jgi:hypothetical protein
MWSDNKVRELNAVNVLNIILVAFRVLPLGIYALMPAFKTILELVLLNGLRSCRRISPDVINVIKMLYFQYFLYLREQKKKTLGARSGQWGGYSSTVTCLLAKNSLRSSDILAMAH